MTYAIFNLINNLIDLYLLIVFAWVIASWLVGFNIINLSHSIARSVVGALDLLVAPVLAPLRKIIPTIGMLDLSLLVLIFLLYFIRDALHSFNASGTVF